MMKQKRWALVKATVALAKASSCFVHFHLQMCFAPQRRAIFHLSATTATSAPAALARLLFERQEPRIIEKHSDSRRPQHFSHVYLLSSDSTRVCISLKLT